MMTEPEWLISVDDHLIEPANLWVDRVPAKYRDIAPHLVNDEHGEAWIYEDKRLPTVGLVAVVGKPKDDWMPTPISYADIRPACYDPRERVNDMDMAGILAQLNFPSLPRFCGQIFKEASDKELALLGVQAWNDFMIDEWCAAAPGRFIPGAMVPMWDAQLAAKEAERAIGKGARCIIFSENAADLGLPSIHDAGGYWDPLFSVANETGLPICMHVGSSSKLTVTAPDAPALVTIALAPMSALKTLYDWMFSGNFLRYPNLKIVLSEGGIGWIPFALMWLDHVVDTQRWAWKTDVDFDFMGGNVTEKAEFRQIVDPDRPPSVLFRDHVFGCFIDDPVGIRNIDLIGVDNVMIETDYPHSDGSWPESINLAHKQLAPLSIEDQRKVMLDNACRVFDFTPAEPPSRTS